MAVLAAGGEPYTVANSPFDETTANPATGTFASGAAAKDHLVFQTIFLAGLDPVDIAEVCPHHATIGWMNGLLDRYAARNANSVHVAADRIAVQPREARPETLAPSQGAPGDIKGRSPLAG